MSLSKELYEARLTSGLCVRCGKKAPAAPGRKLCIDCIERNKKSQKRCYEKRKAAGMCMNCGKVPARPGRVTCADCAKLNSDYYRDADVCDGDCLNCQFEDCILTHSHRDKAISSSMKSRANRVSAGICIRCGQAPARPGRQMCAACAENNAAHSRAVQQARKEAGLCIICGKSVLDGKTRCKSCAHKNDLIHKRRIGERKDKGICTTCGKYPAAPGFLQCTACQKKGRERYAKSKTDIPKAKCRINPYGKIVPPRGHCSLCGAKLPEGKVGLCFDCDKKKRSEE